MEALRHCCSAEETLSYRWLITHNSSLAVADVDAHAACSFIELDPASAAAAAAASTRWTIDVNGFHFANSAGTKPSFPYPSPPPPLNSKSTSLESSNNSKSSKSTVLVQGAASLKRILWRYYLCLLVPLRNKAKGLSLAIPKKPARKRRSWSRGRSSASSSRGSGSRTGIEWCRSNADVSVYDAILHCKKSNGSL